MEEQGSKMSHLSNKLDQMSMPLNIFSGNQERNKKAFNMQFIDYFECCGKKKKIENS